MPKKARLVLTLTLALPLLACGLLSSCDMLETHPYDAHVSGETDINRKNIARIEAALQGRKEFRFAMISDTQRWYDETKDAVKALNKRGDIDFVVHGGDLSDFGVTKEFIWQRDILNKLTMPYVCAIGNHDHLGTGEHVFRRIFGEPDFAFTAGNMRFVVLNTNALDYDYSYPIPNFDFIEEELAKYPEGAEKTVFLMHCAPGSEIFNNNVRTVFNEYIHRFPGLQFCLYGHSHNLSVKALFGDGLPWYECPNIEKRCYLLFTVHEEGYDYEAVEF